jgi:hypothetical protein
MNSTQALAEGTQVQILETPNVMMRHPELVGAVGEVADAAVHPATWFTVRVPDGRLLKFQPTALRPVDAARSARHAAAAAKAAGQAEHKQGKQEARPEQRIGEATQGHAARTLTKGTVVAIHGTDNVQQRVPHLIGKVGVVKEAPVHPGQSQPRALPATRCSGDDRTLIGIAWCLSRCLLLCSDVVQSGV